MITDPGPGRFLGGSAVVPTPRGLIPLFAFIAPFWLAQACAGQTDSPPRITDGVWGLETGEEVFLWDFTQTDDGTPSCTVHEVVGRLKLTETPCRTVAHTNARVEVSMGNGVRLVGELRPGGEALIAQLSYPDGTATDVELLFHPREHYPALFARPPGEGTLPTDSAWADYAYRPPAGRQGGWPEAHAEQVGVHPLALETLVQSIIKGDAGVLHSILVARNGSLVLEEYFHGYQRDDLHPLASCTKSVSSLLVGLAIESGAIPDDESLITDFFQGEEYWGSLGQGWETLTLRHLLTMTMALDWSPEEAADLHGTGPDFFRRVLSRSVSGTPGADWAYVSANVNLLAGVLRQATGRHAEEFAREKLFQPLDIRTWDWEGLKTNGYNLMDGSLRLRPRDMAKVGQLVLAGGTWDSSELFEGDWIGRSTAWSVDTDGGFEGYGYLWWKTHMVGPRGSRLDVTVANGWGSQFIFIVPELSLLVVTTGGNDYNGKHMAVVPLVAELVRSGLDPSPEHGR